MPHSMMSRSLWDALRPLLDRALDLDPLARAAYLDDLRSESPTIVAHLEALLRYEQAGASPRLAQASDFHAVAEYRQIGARATLARPSTAYHVRIWTMRAAALCGLVAVTVALSVGLTH
jgi:hypothetical protein